MADVDALAARIHALKSGRGKPTLEKVLLDNPDLVPAVETYLEKYAKEAGQGKTGPVADQTRIRVEHPLAARRRR